MITDIHDILRSVVLFDIYKCLSVHTEKNHVLRKKNRTGTMYDDYLTSSSMKA